MGDIYSAAEVIDKTLITKKALPYYDGVPELGYTPKQLGTVPAGESAGTVYSFIDADPGENRPTLWWMFYPRSSGQYYYMPHHEGDFDLQSLIDQGAESEAEKNKDDLTWYERLTQQILPIVAITVIGAAAVKGYFSRRSK